MGTNEFQSEYIEYLEECNANLHSKLLQIKEFESRLLNKELRNRHCETALQEITNICNSTCEAIDTLFENFTATMNSLKNVLLWKSQIAQIPKKLSLAMKPTVNEVNHMQISANSDSNFSSINEAPETRNSKKCGTAKVSPMIKGHVISTPRIHLNRVNEDFGFQTDRSLPTTLSPIIEQSPNTSSHETPSPVFREIRIPLQRLQISNFVAKTSASSGESCQSNSSPKLAINRKKPTSFQLKKHYNPTTEIDRFRMIRNRQREADERENKEAGTSVERDERSEATPNCSSEAKENTVVRGQGSTEEVDPLEGPSWLLDKSRAERTKNSGLDSFQYRFINFKRPNYSSFGGEVTDEKREILNFNDDAQMGNFELTVTGEEERPSSFILKQQQNNENNSSFANEETSSGQSSTLSYEPRKSHECRKSDDSESSGTKIKSSVRYSSTDRNSLRRKSAHTTDDYVAYSERQSKVRKSERLERMSNANQSSSNLNKSGSHDLSNNSSRLSYNLNGENNRLSNHATPKRNKTHLVETSMLGRKSDTSQGKCKGAGEVAADDNGKSRSNVQGPMRSKRRAAELCYMKKNWLEISPENQEKCPKYRRRAKNSKSKKKIKKSSPKKH